MSGTEIPARRLPRYSRGRVQQTRHARERHPQDSRGRLAVRKEALRLQLRMARRSPAASAPQPTWPPQGLEAAETA